MTRDFEAPRPPPRGEGEGEAADLFDYEQLKHWVGFVWRGVGRHRSLALTSFILVMVAGAVATVYFPRTYHVESKLLANRSQTIRELGNPRSNLRGDDPTRAAEETIFARDNLVALVRQTNLITRWQETRAPVLRLKDAVVGLVAGPMSDEDKMDSMVGTLEKKLHVRVDAQTVTILIDWPDAQLAYQIVEAAQQNFLETRHVTEMAAISEALSILEVHASRVQDQMDDALAELEKTRETRRKGLRPSSSPNVEGSTPVAPAPPPAPTPDTPRSAVSLATEQELAQIKFLIGSKKRAAADLEDFRARRLAELNAQLAEQRVQYADQHPVILDTLSRIEALKQDSPQLIQLRQDVADLLAEYRRKGGTDPDSLIEPRRNQRAPRQVQAQAQSALSLNELSEDPAVEFARTNLRMATAKYEELMMRIDAARIELDTARAAFKFRYSVVRPASIPKKPVKPNVVLLLLATFLGALGLAVLVGAARDLWRGRLVESWQVERTLGLKVLSEVRLSTSEAKQP
jgi:uncharacterized protein involved in exopolysaccharide biosynthesis